MTEYWLGFTQGVFAAVGGSMVVLAGAMFAVRRCVVADVDPEPYGAVAGATAREDQKRWQDWLAQGATSRERLKP